MTLTDDRATSAVAKRDTSGLAPPVQAGTERAVAFSRAGLEARKRKAERTAEEVAASALRRLLLALEDGTIDVDGRSVGGVIRALVEVTRVAQQPDSQAIAADVVARLQGLAQQRGGGVGGKAPATGQR